VPANLFVALVPPPAALTPLVEAVAGLRDQAPDLGWVAPNRWHVTLCFLGPVEVNDELPDRLARVAARHAPATVRVSGGGRFGKRVLWARLEADLRPLAAGVNRAAERAGYAVEDRPFRAHLTLARGRRNTDLRPLAAELTHVTGPSWAAGEIVLMRGGQPDYERLETWRLSGRHR
jgi:RNA 2',3'-cyclic 3'-phosphodiesterase